MNNMNMNYFYSWRLGDTAGRALYPTLSLVSHSCVANSRYQGEQGQAFNAMKNFIHLATSKM